MKIEYARGKIIPAEEVARRYKFLKEGREAGKSWPEIAEELGISAYSAAAWWHRHIKEKEPAPGKPRPCMLCKQVFQSEGSHNRMCSRCRHLG